MKNFLRLAFLLLILPLALSASIIENFDDISTLTANGWVLTNNSNPLGVSGWFQGNPDIFPAQFGPPESYIGANFNNAAFGGNISNWLLTPVVSMSDYLRLTFYTRTEPNAPAPDRLEVRLSTNGSSSFVGTTDTSVGDFVDLLLTINPTMAIGGYPEAWTQYVIDIPGQGLGVSGRLAFRYWVTDTSLNADYIGIDTVTLESIPEPMTLVTLGTGILGIATRRFFKGR